MSEHFDINATLTITCSRCGKTAGGWDETWKQGWNEITDLDADGDEVSSAVYCPDCEPLWKNESGWGDQT